MPAKSLLRVLHLGQYRSKCNFIGGKMTIESLCYTMYQDILLVSKIFSLWRASTQCPSQTLATERRIVSKSPNNSKYVCSSSVSLQIPCQVTASGDVHPPYGHTLYEHDSRLVGSTRPKKSLQYPLVAAGLCVTPHALPNMQVGLVCRPIGSHVRIAYQARLIRGPTISVSELSRWTTEMAQSYTIP